MTMSENQSNGATTPDRFSNGVTAYRQTRRESVIGAEMTENELTSRTAGQAPEHASALDRTSSLSSLGLPGLSEAAYGTGGWLDGGGPGVPAMNQSMADHPLLRGLLLELPTRGAMPTREWLDRWFEAARSILELLYIQEARR